MLRWVHLRVWLQLPDSGQDQPANDLQIRETCSIYALSPYRLGHISRPTMHRRFQNFRSVSCSSVGAAATVRCWPLRDALKTPSAMVENDYNYFAFSTIFALYLHPYIDPLAIVPFNSQSLSRLAPIFAISPIRFQVSDHPPFSLQ